jgi:hypothetical protein
MWPTARSRIQGSVPSPGMGCPQVVRRGNEISYAKLSEASYTPGSRPAFAGDALLALLAGSSRPCLPNSNRDAACSQHYGRLRFGLLTLTT